MIFSDKHKFIFIAVPKVASSSLETWLTQRSGIEDVKLNKAVLLDTTNYKGGPTSQILGNKYLPTSMCPVRYFYKHLSLSEALKLYPRFKDYTSFAFVRNPWDRLVSQYNYSGGHWCRKHGVKNTFIDYVTKLVSEGKTFTGHTYEHKLNPKALMGDPHFNQLPFLTNATGGVVDHIGRFENLQEDFNSIFKKMGIPSCDLPHLNKTKHKHYTEYYDDDTKRIVAENS